MSQNLFEQVIDFNNIESAYKKALCGDTKFTHDAIIFSMNEVYNLLDLQRSLKYRTYKPGEFIEFYVYEPKERLIHAPKFRDKIVQLLLYNSLSSFYNNKFIKDSYASIENRGTHKCLSQIHHYMRKAYWEYGNDAYIIKVDMKKFFYSIDRELLKLQISKKITNKDYIDLLFCVIDSASQISEKGLPLGNTSSQVLANIMMDKLDKYCKCKLRIKYYCRYMDDIFIIVPNKQIAQEVLHKIKSYTEKSLHLTCNKKKTKLFPIHQGVNMVGFKIHPTHRLLRSESKNKMKRKMRKLEKLYLNGEINAEKVEQIINSWLGHAKNGNTFNLVNKLINDNSIYFLNGDKISVKKEESHDLLQEWGVPYFAH